MRQRDWVEPWEEAAPGIRDAQPWLSQCEASLWVVGDGHGSVSRSCRRAGAQLGCPVQVIGQTHDLLDAVDPLAVGCIVADLDAVGRAGAGLSTWLVERGIFLPVILVGADGDVSTAVQAIKQGAADFLVKPLDAGELAERICHILKQSFGEASCHRMSLVRRLCRLTAREREVAALLAEGMLRKTIADRLQISIKTVDVHCAHIARKFEVRTPRELVPLLVRALIPN